MGPPRIRDLRRNGRLLDVPSEIAVAIQACIRVSAACDSVSARVGVGTSGGGRAASITTSSLFALRFLACSTYKRFKTRFVLRRQVIGLALSLEDIPRLIVLDLILVQVVSS